MVEANERLMYEHLGENALDGMEVLGVAQVKVALISSQRSRTILLQLDGVLPC